MKLDIINIFKIIILVYIVISPFIDYKKLIFLNTVPCKLIFLLIIIALSFIDMQLTILSMITFFILVINFNKIEMSTIMQNDKKTLILSDVYDFGDFEPIKSNETEKTNQANQMSENEDDSSIEDSSEDNTYDNNVLYPYNGKFIILE